MDGLILHEETKYVTYMLPIFDAIGLDLVQSLNWRLSYVEVGSISVKEYSFGNCYDYWISGNDLVDEVMKNPDIQWWWGLLQGFKPDVTEETACKEEPVDIKMDTQIWTNPVTMRNPDAEIEIEAFDSSLSVVITDDATILERLKSAFRRAELLSEYNNY